MHLNALAATKRCYKYPGHKMALYVLPPIPLETCWSFPLGDLRSERLGACSGQTLCQLSWALGKYGRQLGLPAQADLPCKGKLIISGAQHKKSRAQNQEELNQQAVRKAVNPNGSRVPHLCFSWLPNAAGSSSWIPLLPPNLLNKKNSTKYILKI